MRKRKLKLKSEAHLNMILTNPWSILFPREKHIQFITNQLVQLILKSFLFFKLQTLPTTNVTDDLTFAFQLTKSLMQQKSR